MVLEKLLIQDPKKAVIVMAVFAVTSGAIVTYIGAVLTTLEKRFDFNSMEMGLLMCANDIGYLVTVILFAYYGSKKNRQPLMLFLSGVGLWLSCVIYTIPYFVFGSRYEKETLLSQNGSTGKGYCLSNFTAISPLGRHPVVNTDIDKLQKYSTMSIMMLAGILNGVASSPFWSIGISFMDEIAGATKSGIYIGILFGLRVSSALIGYLIGSYCLLYQESMKLKVSNYPPGQKDVKWIGAWWLGWLILGFSILIPSPFMLLLRSKKKNRKEKLDNDFLMDNSENHQLSTVQSEKITNNSYKGLKLKRKKRSICHEFIKFLKTVRDALKNKAFSLYLIGFLFDYISFMTLFTFFTKFLEYHYRASASIANIMTATSLSGSSALAAVLSGIISKYYITTKKNTNRFNVIVNVVAAVLFPIAFIFSCQSVEIGGLDNQSRIRMCSGQCSCQTKKMDPICYNGTTYYSPCVAGCADLINKTFYSNCGCQTFMLGKKGFCEEMCLSIYGFLILYVMTRIIGTGSIVQCTQLVMGFATEQKTRAVNLAISVSLFCICGTVLPPLAGMILDTACLYRNVNKFKMQSHCLVYDNDKMRHILLGIGFVSQIPACIFYALSWHYTPDEDMEATGTNHNVPCSMG